MGYDNDEESQPQEENTETHTFEDADKLLEQLEALPDKNGKSSLDNEETQILKRASASEDIPEQQLSPQTGEIDGETQVYVRKPAEPEPQEKKNDGTKILARVPGGVEDSGEQRVLSDAEEALAKLENLPPPKEIKIMAAAKSSLEFLLSQLSSLSERVYSKEVDDIIAKPLANGERYSEPDKYAILAMFNDLSNFITAFEGMEKVVGQLPPDSIVELLNNYHVAYQATMLLAREAGIKDEIKPENLAAKLKEKIEELKRSKGLTSYIEQHIRWQRDPRLYGFSREKDRKAYSEKEADLFKSFKERFSSQKTTALLNQYPSSDDETKEKLDQELAQIITDDKELAKRFFGEGYNQYKKSESLEEELKGKLAEIKEHRKRDPLRWLQGHITDLRTGEHSKYFPANRKIQKLACLWDPKSEIHYGEDDDYNKDVVDKEMAKIMADDPETWKKSTAAMLELLHKAERDEKQTVRKYTKLCAGLNTSGIVGILYKSARELRNEEHDYQASVGKMRLAKDIIEKVANTREICPDQYPAICAELGSDLLYLAKDESDMGVKKTLIEESIENSKSAYESASGIKNPSVEVQQAKAIASHNLSYSYNLLASLSSGETAEEYKKEAGKYSSADKVKKELNIDIN